MKQRFLFLLGFSLLVIGVAARMTLHAALIPAGGTTERVSVNALGEEGNGDSEFPAVSADGRFVAFSSSADNLVADDTNGLRDIFMVDRETGLVERLNVSSAGEEANGLTGRWADISADGRYVTFYSVASNLVVSDTNGFYDIFVHDRWRTRHNW